MIQVIVPSYNCGSAFHHCLDSIQKQSLDKFNVVVVDDASTQKQHKYQAEHYCGTNGWTLVRLEENSKAPFSIRAGIDASKAAPEDIIFIVDGDDKIPKGALSYVSGVYEQYEDIWLTYGSYVTEPYDPLCPTVQDYPTLTRWNRDFRTYPSIFFNHPLTFKRFLWDQLTDRDLQDSEGKWFTCGYDQVIMYPMLEMAAPDHYAVLDEHLYHYNTTNPLSEVSLSMGSPKGLRDREKKKRFEWDSAF